MPTSWARRCRSTSPSSASTATSSPSSPRCDARPTASTTTRAGCSTTRCATSAAPASTATTRPARACASSASKGVKLSQDFGRNIRDDVRSVRLAPERLAGLPEDYREAHPADDDGLVTITTDYPDLVPFMTFGSDGEARRELSLAAEQRRLAGQRPGPPGPLRGAPRDRRAARLRLVARLRHRGQDDRHRRGRRRVHRPDQRRRQRAGRPGARRAPRAQARRRARRRHRGDLRLALLLRAGAPRAVRRRRPGRAHLLPLRAGPPGPPRRHRPALRPRVDAGRPRRGAAPGTRTSRPTTSGSAGGGSAASTSTCTRARASSSTPRSSTWSGHRRRPAARGRAGLQLQPAA